MRTGRKKDGITTSTNTKKFSLKTSHSKIDKKKSNKKSKMEKRRLRRRNNST